MRIHYTETLRLTFFIARIHEQVVRKPTIVRVVMADDYSMRFCEVFERLFRFNRFQTRCRILQVDEA
jgi:hypothetical protein